MSQSGCGKRQNEHVKVSAYAGLGGQTLEEDETEIRNMPLKGAPSTCRISPKKAQEEAEDQEVGGQAVESVVGIH